jgi:hypothetical protein
VPPDHDPLHLSSTAKNPYFDYQWHPVGGLAVGPWSRYRQQSDGDTGWIAVSRNAMPNEPSNSDEFIQRAEMRLFFRLRAMSGKARLEDIERALAPVRKVDAMRSGHGFPGIAGNIRVPERAAFKEPERAQAYWPACKTRVEKHKRGRVLVIHEMSVPKKWRAWAARRQWRPLNWRIAYLSRDESEMANRQGTSYADWAWAKIDLFRERQIPSPSNPTLSYRQASRRWRRHRG